VKPSQVSVMSLEPGRCAERGLRKELEKVWGWGVLIGEEGLGKGCWRRCGRSRHLESVERPAERENFSAVLWRWQCRRGSWVAGKQLTGWLSSIDEAISGCVKFEKKSLFWAVVSWYVTRLWSNEVVGGRGTSLVKRKERGGAAKVADFIHIYRASSGCSSQTVLMRFKFPIG
jgi:hypothetical protein